LEDEIGIRKLEHRGGPGGVSRDQQPGLTRADPQLMPAQMPTVAQVQTERVVAFQRQAPVLQRDAEGVARLDDRRVGKVD
jgi:hypothetical protein